MLKSLKFHWDFCFVCGDSWQKLFFSLLQTAGKLLCCSPKFGELPQKDLCGQLAQVLTPSPCVDLVFEKGHRDFVCGSFINFFLGMSCRRSIKDVVVRTLIHPTTPPHPTPRHQRSIKNVFQVTSTCPVDVVSRTWSSGR